jgi:hypothetical protein
MDLEQHSEVHGFQNPFLIKLEYMQHPKTETTRNEQKKEQCISVETVPTNRGEPKTPPKRPNKSEKRVQTPQP